MLSEFECFLLLYCPDYWSRTCAPLHNDRPSPRSADHHHPRQRLLSKNYKAKKRIVRGIWIATGLLMIGFPLPPFMVTLGLFTTFLSFTILDESA